MKMARGKVGRIAKKTARKTYRLAVRAGKKTWARTKNPVASIKATARAGANKAGRAVVRKGRRSRRRY